MPMLQTTTADRISRFVFLIAVIALFWTAAACGGSGGDDPTDGDGTQPDGDCGGPGEACCTPGFTCNSGLSCVDLLCILVEDGDTPDGDTPDGDEDGDKPDGDAPDGDIPDGDPDDDGSDGDTPDGDQPDGDDGDQDSDPFEGDVDVDYPGDEDEFDVDSGDDCIPGQDWMCPADYYCNNDGKCKPNPIDGDIEFDGDGEYCENGYPVCDSHADCPRAVGCDPDSNCCDDRYIVTCDITAECPGGTYCSGLHVCTYDCLTNDGCDGLQNEYCNDDGICLPYGSGGDADEEELPPCTSCGDCYDWFGPGYYCNQNQALCLEMPAVNGCCQHSDCTAEPNGLCNFQTGTCAYLPDNTNRGVIAGNIYIHNELGMFGVSVRVTIEDTYGDPVDSVAGLVPSSMGSYYHTNYAFSTLPVGDYVVIAEFENFPTQPYPNPFNPIQIDYFSTATTIREDIDFYMGMPDPRLATISGNVMLAEFNQYFGVEVMAYRANADFDAVELVVSDWGGPYSSGMRAYELGNLPSGFYLLVALMRHDGIAEPDYYSKLIQIDLNANPGQSLTDIPLYFGVSGTGLGTVTGTVSYLESYDPETIEVYLYNQYTWPYVVSKALKGEASETSFEYSFANIEAGTYWIRAETTFGEELYTAEPSPNSVDIEEDVGTIFTGRDISFTQEPPVDGDFDFEFEFEVE